LNVLNIMHLATAQSAILSAVIFNALNINALIPLTLRAACATARWAQRHYCGSTL
jgi:high-affinity K+ transport system ATPase subunit B